MRRKNKKETYRQRWLKQHPDIHLHLPREVYDKLLKLENILGKSKTDIVKDLINGIVIKFDEYRKKIEDEIANESYVEGYDFALERFVNSPEGFYNEVKRKFKIEPMLFSVPCKYCKKPIVISHKDEDRDEIQGILNLQFDYEYHDCCDEVRDGKRDSCEHMKKPG
jgi:hypothetical protein